LDSPNIEDNVGGKPSHTLLFLEGDMATKKTIEERGTQFNKLGGKNKRGFPPLTKKGDN